MKWNKKCRFFNEKYACDTLSTENYKSCEECKFAQEYSKKILIIKLGAMGDVLRTTCILPALRKKYGQDILIYWMTNPESIDLLKNNSFIDKILPYNLENVLRIQQEEFNILFALEIDTPSTLLANLVKANEKFGYFFDNGTTTCFNKSAEDYLETAFLNHVKIKNRKTYQQLIIKTCELIPYYTRGKPIFNLTNKEIEFSNQFKLKNNIQEGDKVVGINIGSADRWASKFWNNEKIKQLIRQAKGYKIVILARPNEIKKQENLIRELKKEGIFLINNNPRNTLREFASVVNICDVIICGDTMALHLALALGKKIISLFFSTPGWEVEGYENITKLTSPLLEKYFFINQYVPELAESISIERVLKALDELNLLNSNK